VHLEALARVAGATAERATRAGAALATSAEAALATSAEAALATWAEAAPATWAGAAPATSAAGGEGNAGGGCQQPSDCPDTGSECVSRACHAGECGTEAVAAGTPVGDQVPGDCALVVCDGAGGLALEDADDPASDLDPCTDDVCEPGGATAHPPAAAGAPCGVGLSCDGAGSCVGCVVPSDCGPDPSCSSRTCVGDTCGLEPSPQGTPAAAQTPGDCQEVLCDGAGGVTSVATDDDLPPDTACATGVCTQGTPSHAPLPDTTPCPNGGQCVAGLCVTPCAVPSIDGSLGSSLGGVAAGSTTGQSSDYASTACQANTNGPDVAFEWVPPSDGCFQLDTDGSTFDTVLSVRRCSDGAEVACDDDSGIGAQSKATLFGAQTSETYVIVVDGFGSTNGSFMLAIAPVPCSLPPTEHIVGCPPGLCALALGAGPHGGDLYTYVLPGSAHPDVDDVAGSVCASYGNGHDLVLELDASGYSSFSVSTCAGNAGDSSISAYAAAPPAGALLGCNADANGAPSFCSKLGNPSVPGGTAEPLALTTSELFVVVDEFAHENYWNGVSTRTIVVELVP
jgi:hypothetical protein